MVSATCLDRTRPAILYRLRGGRNGDCRRDLEAGGLPGSAIWLTRRARADEHAGVLPAGIEPLELSAAIGAGRLIGDGVGWRVARAVAAALPGAVHPDGRVVLSAGVARCGGTGIQPAGPGVLG
jgi:hypothetical protein